MVGGRTTAIVPSRQKLSGVSAKNDNEIEVKEEAKEEEFDADADTVSTAVDKTVGKKSVVGKPSRRTVKVGKKAPRGKKRVREEMEVEVEAKVEKKSSRAKRARNH